MTGAGRSLADKTASGPNQASSGQGESETSPQDISALTLNHELLQDQSFRRRVDDLNQAIFELIQDRHDQSKKTERGLEQVRREIKELTEEKSRLKRKSDTMEALRKQVQSRRDREEKEISQLLDDIDDKDEEIEELEAKIDSLMEEDDGEGST